jgi:hypothetical protein
MSVASLFLTRRQDCAAIPSTVAVAGRNAVQEEGSLCWIFFSCWSRDKMVASTWELGSAIAADLKIVQSLTGIGKS